MFPCLLRTVDSTRGSALSERPRDASCLQTWPWVGIIHGLGWVGSEILAYEMGWVGLS